MLTPSELFFRSRDVEIGNDAKITANGVEQDLIVRMAIDFESGCKYFKFLVENSVHAPEVCKYIMQNMQTYMVLDNDLIIKSGLDGFGEESDSRNLGFTGRIVFWTYFEFSNQDREKICQLGSSLGLRILIRDRKYIDARNKAELPLAFISHDSRDKEIFVRGFASQISQSGFSVWYDEYSLSAGDSLRKNIESGLKSCPKCIIVLSNNFISNDGWASREFDSIYTREIVEKRNIIIPMWLNITRNDVYNYSPILADRVAIIADPKDVGDAVRKTIIAISSL